jgi:hypothetical protein
MGCAGCGLDDGLIVSAFTKDKYVVMIFARGDNMSNMVSAKHSVYPVINDFACEFCSMMISIRSYLNSLPIIMMNSSRNSCRHCTGVNLFQLKKCGR